MRTAPGAGAAFAVLVLVTAFLAAGFPRVVQAYENHGLRSAVDGAPAVRSTVQVSTPGPGIQLPDAEREAALRPGPLAEVDRRVHAMPADPLRAVAAESSHGVETSEPLLGTDRWLPRPETVPPHLTLAAQAGLPEHAKVVEGRLPAVRGTVTGRTKAIEAVVTPATAKALNITVGRVVHLGDGGPGEAQLSVRITGLVEPRSPQGAYWSANSLLRTPGMAATTGPTPQTYWKAALLIAPEAAPALLGTQGAPRPYWRIAPATANLTAADVPALTARIAALEDGPGLVRLRETVDENAEVTTELDGLLAEFTSMRAAIAPVVAVAAVGVGTVALVVLAMTGGLFAARRESELALLRSRGGSLAGIGGRLLAESAVVAVPAAGLGLALALAAVPDARAGQAVLAATAVAAVACAALPLRAVVRHRTPLAHGGRSDLVPARPSRRRTVAELTLLVLAVGAVTALRRRGTSDAGDLLVSAAPVLLALIAALVLVRLYPLPLRWAARPAARLRGAVGFLSLARAGRASAVGALPLLALLAALSTAAFGGAVLAGIDDARARAALLATGADARVTGPRDSTALPPGAEEAVRKAAGVRSVTTAQIEHALTLPPPRDGVGDPPAVSLVAVDPAAYAALTRALDLGAFPADALRSGAGDDTVPAVVTPGVAAYLGEGAHRVDAVAGEFRIEVAAVRERTPAVTAAEFVIVDRSRLTRVAPTALLVTGAEVDGPALRAAAREAGGGPAADGELTVRLRSEARAAFTDSPLQAGAERVYGAAVAAGAGYAVLALLLSLLQSAPERAVLLARLRTMGLTTRQGRRLLAAEALPPAALAAAGGVLTGWATIVLLAPGVDLVRLALAAAPGVAPLGSVPLRADAWSLGAPAAAVVLLAGAVAGVQAWWAGRRGSVQELRAGDMR
ncbi:ABC transporter permease [Streptomyces sp. NPDC005805]|uniref:ABC transporter permease n=1 Tax=Streptomyces sp. NPDC005805 TaxID=3157068 RepID=UPI0033D5A205